MDSCLMQMAKYGILVKLLCKYIIKFKKELYGNCYTALFYLHFISYYLVIAHTHCLIPENNLLNVSSPFIKHLLSLFYSYTHLI